MFSVFGSQVCNIKLFFSSKFIILGSYTCDVPGLDSLFVWCQGKKAVSFLQYCRIPLVCNKIFLSRHNNISVRYTVFSATLFFEALWIDKEMWRTAFVFNSYGDCCLLTDCFLWAALTNNSYRYDREDTENRFAEIGFLVLLVSFIK